MTVWIAVYHSNSYYAGNDEILGVYATKEEAKNRIAKFEESNAFYDGDCPDECWYDEYEIGKDYNTMDEFYEDYAAELEKQDEDSGE